MQMKQKDSRAESGEAMLAAGGAPQDGESTFSWWAYADVILRRWWVVIGISAFVFLAAILYTAKTVPIFKGVTRIKIEQALPLPRLHENQEAYIGDPYDFYQTQYRLLESRRIADRVVKRLKLADDPEFARKADPVAVFMRHVKIQPVRNSRLVDIEVLHPSPATTKRWADALAEDYIADTMERRIQVERGALAEMTKEIDPLRGRLDAQERAIQSFREQHQLVAINERQSLLERRLEELTTLLTGAEKERRDLEATQEKIALLLKGGDVQSLFSLSRIQTSPLCQKIQEEQVRLLQEREDLSKTYKAQHPKLLAVESRLQSLVNSLRREAERIVDGVRASYEEAVAREAKAREALDASKKEKVRFDRDVIELSQLQREAEAARTLYKNLLSRIQESKVTSSFELTNITVVDPAQEPTTPVSPNWLLNLTLGVLGGLAAGLAAAFLVEQVDNTVDSPDKVERCLGVPLLGLVPRVSLNGHADGGKVGADKAARPAPAAVAPAAGTGLDRSPDLFCYWDGMSRGSEAFRAIRTAIQFSGSTGRPVRTMAVVSVAPREGKTLSALNLAIVMAQAGHRVLIVDSDLRCPRIHKILCPSLAAPLAGLSNILIGEMVLDRVVRGTAIPNLWCVPAGPIPPNPSELLGSPRMAEFLKEASEKYDRILFDTPPVGAVTDACVVAPHLDGVVQVIGFSRVTCTDVRLGRERLVSLGARYLGAILNDVPVARWRLGRYGMGRYYERYGGYGQSGDVE
jgi:capsular exopolysaccharide synthesis family protein